MQPTSAQITGALRVSALPTGSNRTARRGEAVSVSATPMEHTSPSTKSVTYGACRNKVSELVMTRQSSGPGNLDEVCEDDEPPARIDSSFSASCLPPLMAAALVSRGRSPISKPRSLALSISASVPLRPREPSVDRAEHAAISRSAAIAVMNGIAPRRNEASDAMRSLSVMRTSMYRRIVPVWR